ncbi:MAG: hypothetical protein KGZ35_08255 [Truepera sp.]|nr:hypothetical protein [Truepera sp.]
MDPWERLVAPFTDGAVCWRVAERSLDGLTVRLRPGLTASAIRARLDEVLGKAGWSYALFAVGEQALGCNLTILGMSRAAVVAIQQQGLEACADEALARAAEQFELLPPHDLAAEYWVEADPETGAPLYEPHQQPAAIPEAEKSAGRQAIDRLLERLKASGAGREAAALIVQYGGYGRSPEASRELYAKLRVLLQEAIRRESLSLRSGQP